MIRKLIILLIFTTLFFSVKAQKLSFNEDETFKIVQFTDMHYVHGNPKSDTTLLLIPRVLDAEKPDMVVFTGDIVTGPPVQEGWDALTKFVIDRKIPFAVTLGNHDHEQGVTREEIARMVTAYPYNLNTTSSKAVGRVMDDVIPVYSSEKDLSVSALIYCFDSGAYSTLDGVKGYGWITTDQIEWYKKQSLHYTVKNNFRPLPALAYFHIPLPEYRLAFNDEKNARYGIRLEDECPPQLNAGMFLAMREMGDVMSTFVGHDHVNNYIVAYYDIALAYGCFSGWKTTYTPRMNGVRVVVLKKEKREFDTWLRLLDGTIQDKTTFPADFTNPDVSVKPHEQ
jgi:Predicted phosphohydrolases